MGNSPEKDPEKDQPKNWVEKYGKGLGLLTVITADILGYTGAGFALGYWLWKKEGLPWWILMLTASGGLVLAFYRLYQVSKKEWND